MSLRKDFEMDLVTGFEGVGSPSYWEYDVEFMENGGEAYLKSPRDVFLNKETLNRFTQELAIFQNQIDVAKPKDPNPNPTTDRVYTFVEAMQLMEINRGLVVQCIETLNKYYISEDNKFICLNEQPKNVLVSELYAHNFVKA